MSPNTISGVTTPLEKCSVRGVQDQQQQQQQQQRQRQPIHEFDHVVGDDSDDDVMDGIFDDDDDESDDNDNTAPSRTSPFMKLIPTAYFVESPTRKMPTPRSATFTPSTTNNNANGNSNGYVNGSVQQQQQHQQQQQQQQSSKSIVPFPTMSPPENEKGVDRLLLLARYPNANEQKIQLTLQQKQIQKEVAMISATKKAQLFRDKLQQQQQQQQQRQEEEERLKMQQQQQQQQQQQYPSYYQQQQPPLALFQPAFFDEDDDNDVEEGRFHFKHGDFHDNSLSSSNSTNTTRNSILPRRSKDSSGTDDNDDDDDGNDKTIEYDTAGIDNNTTPSKNNVRSQSIIDKTRRSFISHSGNRINPSSSKRRSFKNLASNFMEKVFSTTIDNGNDNDNDNDNNIPPIRLNNDDNEDDYSESELPIMTNEVASTSQSIVSASDCSLYTDKGSRGGDTISSKISNPNSVMTRKISNVTTSNMNDYDNMNMNMNRNHNQNNQNRIRGNSESTAHRSTEDHGDERNNNINDNDDDEDDDDSGSGSGSGSKKGLLFLLCYCSDRKKKNNGLLIFIFSFIVVIAIMVTVLAAIKGRQRQQQSNKNNNPQQQQFFDDLTDEFLFLQPSQSPSTITIPNTTTTMVPSIATITMEGGATETATPTVQPTTIVLSSTNNEEQEIVSSSVASSAAAAAADTVADSSTTSSTTTYSDGTNLILQVPTNRPTSNTNIDTNSHSPTSNNELTTMTPSQSPTSNVVSPLSSSLLPTSNPTKTLFSTWTWTDLGAPMIGTEIDQQYGQSVAISHDGNIMAVGASGALSQSGVVRIYQLSKDGTGWISITSLLGRNEGDQFGSTVALSADGSVLAVSEPFYNGMAGDKTGNVRTYVRSPFGGYIRLGQDIEGNSATDHFGLGLALSSNGRRLAVGAPYRDNSASSNNGSSSSSSSSSNRLVSGAVKVYEWSIPDDKWMRIVGDNSNVDEINDAVLTTTAPLIGESDLDWFGWSLDLNDDGSLLCVGAPRNSDFGGYVQCFEELKQDSPSNHIQWTLVGDTIRNNQKPVRYDDNFGAAISVSRDPTGTRHRVAIAAPGKNGTKKSLFDSGIVIVYEFNPNNPERGWIQLGRTEIASVNPGKDFQMGYSIDLHGDLLLVGVPGAASNTASGQMELFEFERSSWHWKRQPRIFQGLTGSNYGSAVRMTPDGTTIVVGSPQSEENNYGGAINVYRKD